jgi:hypothetical protein
LKTFIPGFRPRKFVFDVLHRSNGSDANVS